MKKLVRGIVEFRNKRLPKYQELFSSFANGQNPDALFVTCSDSRIAPNWFASTDPGDLFVIRNVGNIIPCCHQDGHSTADESEAAAIEFAILNLKVADIIVCGHSDCGAMHALLKGREKIEAPHLRAWLRHAEGSLDRERKGKLSPENELSQQNVLLQLEHLRSYQVVKEQVLSGKLNLHGWWFDLYSGNVFAYEESSQSYVLIDEAEAKRIIARLK